MGPGSGDDSHVSDGVWDEERGDLLVSLLHHVFYTILKHSQAAHSRPDDHPRPAEHSRGDE